MAECAEAEGAAGCGVFRHLQWESVQGAAQYCGKWFPSHVLTHPMY